MRAAHAASALVAGAGGVFSQLPWRGQHQPWRRPLRRPLKPYSQNVTQNRGKGNYLSAVAGVVVVVVIVVVVEW